ncbi:histidine kinase-like ATPase [Umbelopsis sp. PMI_123]|nr:histidine kinase-like ATPase [Umbelopsis sp. PMI_123]
MDVRMGKYTSLRCEVIEIGIGIAAEQQKSLFGPFAQVDGSTTRLHGGIGLGLSICLQAVRLMSGSIGAISEGKDKGSKFWFTVKEKRDIPGKLVRQNSSYMEELGAKNILLISTHEPTAHMAQSLIPNLTLR